MLVLRNRPGFKVVQGDILQDRAKLFVCPVNCRPGIMGAGLATQFASRFPGLRLRHKLAVEKDGLALGHPKIVSIVQGDRDDSIVMSGYDDWPRTDIILFPTKDSWDQDCRLDWVFTGLANLYSTLADYRRDDEEVRIAFPALGCGLGDLAFEAVGPMISVWAMALPERYETILYHPHGSSRR